MSNTPKELMYTREHEWLRDEGNGEFTVGITEHAQETLGDMVFVDLPEVGTVVSAGDDVAVFFKQKTAYEIYAPLSGEIVAVNGELNDAPELVNEQPYQEGWIFRIKASDTAELADLIDAAGYTSMIEAEE